MRVFRVLIQLIVLSLLGGGYLSAATIPQLSIQHFSLNGLDTVSQEIVVGKVMSNISRDFNGEIKIIWTSERYALAVKLLRNALIDKGVDPYRVRLSYDAGGYRESGSEGVQIYLQQIVIRSPECQNNIQSYRFKKYFDRGCVAENLRSRALVNPLEYVF